MSNSGYFDGFNGVLDLEDTSFGGEGIDTTIIVAPDWKPCYLLPNILLIPLF